MSHSAVLVLGDQLSLNSPLLDARAQTVIMVESLDESRVVWSHKTRTALFLSAMRHFAKALESEGFNVLYSDLEQTGKQTLLERVFQLCARHGITELHVLEPGEWRLEQALVEGARNAGLSLQVHDDPHFLCTRAEFAKWAGRYKELRMEFFYREMRKQFNVLMQDGQPCGGKWNFDASNRKAYPKSGPGEIAKPLIFEPDEITEQVISQVARLLPNNPGELKHFGWPVTRDQALNLLHHFVEYRLPNFGTYQDAMWTNTPFGWHSLLSAAINLHLLDPREVIAAAEKAYTTGRAQLPDVEGFIRQILGWREFMRGVYWLDMPAMRKANWLKAELALPKWYWTAQVNMQCMKDCVGQTLEFGYAHHIQRLMVLGNFALMAGISPQAVEDWFLAVYVDAIEWVELPNVAGMALFANGGRFTSKPYVASGAYVKRMSNYCQNCQYDPARKHGENACPMTVFYWDFLDRHEEWMNGNPRTGLMIKNLQRMSDEDRMAVRQTAERYRQSIEVL